MPDLYSSIIGRSEMPFQLFIGARGVGKTYSALSYLAKRDNSVNKFLFMRRTDSEIERLITKYTNPFKTINRDQGLTIDAEYMSKERYGLFYDNFIDSEEPPNVIGYAAALSTFAKMRGIDYNDVDVIVFDEIVPEKHVHKITGEGEAFLHMYETINRNREFDGREPLKIYMLCNSINLNNDILLSLGIVSVIADMKVKGRSRYTDKKRGIYIELMENAEFRKRKGETALYRLTGGTEFSEQALNNRFTQDDFTPISKVKLIEYNPLFTFGAYTVYSHKNTSALYICKKKAVGVLNYEECDRDIMYWRFAPRYRQMVLARMVKYDDYATKLVFDSLTKRQ